MKIFYKKGFTLVEVLVSVIVIGVGILGLAKLNGNLLQGTGLSKSRADATKIAQQELEWARNLVAGQGCSVLLDEEKTVNGVNASYKLSTDYNGSITTNNMEITVTATWADKEKTNNQVVLKSVVSCLTSGDSALATGGTGIGNFLKNPTGRGKVGGEGSYEPGAIPGTANKISGTDLLDGTKTYVKNKEDEGEVVELIDASGKVQLSFNKNDCEIKSDEDTGFSTISGKVFVKADNKGDPIVTSDELFVISSDASYCSLLDFDTDRVLPSGSSGKGINYFYTYYKCYFGPEWWGNVGIIRTDNAPTTDRVCVGNPTSLDIKTSFSKHAQLYTTRGYRGYREVTADVYESQGIGVYEAKKVSDSCGYIAKHYLDHHFVVSSGISNDSSCLNEETIVTSAMMGSSPGKYYCMSSDDGLSCPDLIGTNPPITTIIGGTISINNEAELVNAKLTVRESTVSGGNCTFQAGENNYTYSCVIDWSGFANNGWSGEIEFTTASSSTLCADNANFSVTPENSDLAFVINDKNAVVDPNSVEFTDVQSSITEITLNFNANSSCPRLGQPDVVWEVTPDLNDPNDFKQLKWYKITNATSYNVYICASPKKEKSLTKCTPSTSISPISETRSINGSEIDVFVVKPKPNSGYTTCIKVEAKNNDVNVTSPSSPLKCIYNNGTSYEYL